MQIKEILEYEAPHAYTFEEISGIALRHAKIMHQQRGDHGIIEMRKHLGWYFKGFSGASEIRKSLMQVKSLEEIVKVIKVKV